MKSNQFWAKTAPFQSVTTHGIVSGYICNLMKEYLSPGSRALVASQMGMTEEELIAFMGYLVSLHDVGKIEYHFQCKDPKMKSRLKEIGIETSTVGKENVRHEKTGAIGIRRIWEQQDQDDDALDIFSALIGAHHQKDYGKESNSREPFFADRRQDMEAMMRARFLPDSDWQLPEIPNEEGVFEAILLGIMILSDWIASGTVFADAENWIHREDSEAEILRKTEGFLIKSGLKKEIVDWKTAFPEIWPLTPRTWG